LKKSFVELCGTEKRHMLLPYGANQHHFCQRKRNSVSLKSQQFNFSIGWAVFCDILVSLERGDGHQKRKADANG
jgi:hypothetical protein